MRLDLENSLLPHSFFNRPVVAEVARDLIGTILVSNFGNELTAGIIVETEAYSGTDDRACHAHNKKRTPRTETMFLPGGHAYVYLCYGLHHLFNVVTNVEEEPDAVLIRAIQPIQGLDTMSRRRNLPQNSLKISRGPACLSQALGINRSHNGISMSLSGNLWICRGIELPGSLEIQASPRIGVDYAGEDSKKPWRFFFNNNPWVSGVPGPKSDFLY